MARLSAEEQAVEKERRDSEEFLQSHSLIVGNVLICYPGQQSALM